MNKSNEAQIFVKQCNKCKGELLYKKNKLKGSKSNNWCIILSKESIKWQMNKTLRILDKEERARNKLPTLKKN